MRNLKIQDGEDVEVLRRPVTSSKFSDFEGVLRSCTYLYLSETDFKQQIDNFLDVVLICYATDSPESLRNVTQMWVEEIRHYCPNTPILLIATKSDLKKAETAVR